MGIGDWFKGKKGADKAPASEKKPESAKAELPPGFGIHVVQLLFDAPPTIDPARILERVRAHRPKAELAPGASPAITMVTHPDHPAPFKGGKSVPPLTTVTAASAIQPGDPITTKIQESLRQTWEWPAAKEAVAGCKHVAFVTEMMTMTLPPLVRLEIFIDTLAGVVEALQPRAINWIPTQRLMDPVDFLAEVKSGDPDRRHRTALNVRLFNIEGTDGDVVMDSLGLAIVGIPDVQVHARGLDVRQLGAHLYNCALYLLAKGDVVEDGNTMQGLTPEQKWRCQHEEALVEPKRFVLDMDPGPPHAAGKRSWMQ